VLAELGSKQLLIRYEHLRDYSRWHEIILSLITFRMKAPISNDFALSAFQALKCLDKFSTRKNYDEVDISNFVGQPYADASLVNEMAKNLEPYLIHFGYPLEPPRKQYAPGFGEASRRRFSNLSSSLIEDRSTFNKEREYFEYRPHGPLPSPVEPARYSDMDSYLPPSIRQATPITAADRGTGVKAATVYSQNSYCSKLNNSLGSTIHASRRPGNPPLLVALPGSGVTWVRKVLEMSTGLLTGSITDSLTSKAPYSPATFPAERQCHSELAAIYVPTVSSVTNTLIDRKSFQIRDRTLQSRCRLKEKTFSKMILVVRNPYDAMIAAYMQERAGPSANRSSSLDVDDNWKQFILKQAAYYQEYAKLFHFIVTDGNSKRSRPQLQQRAVILKYENLLLEGENSEATNDYEPDSALFRQAALFIIENINGAEGAVIHDMRIHCAKRLLSFSDPYDIRNIVISSDPYPDDLVQTISPLLAEYNTLFKYSKPDYTVRATTAFSQPLASYIPHLLFVEAETGRESDHNPQPPVIIPKLAPMIRCAQHFSYRSFRTEPTKQRETLTTGALVPPLLLSFAGSGNTWVRVLIEFATGIYTGSTDPADRTLKEEFIGENFCNYDVSIIKAHPPQLVLKDRASKMSLRTGGEAITVLRDSEQRSKCSVPDAVGAGNVTLQFRRYILLVRDPYTAIFAEVNRELTTSHIGSVTADSFFSTGRWYALILREAKDYAVYWKELISEIVKYPGNVHIVRYESLLDYQKRYQELASLATYIFPVSAHAPPSLERIYCAFTQADIGTIHRKKSLKSMTADLLYRNQSLVDEIWPYVEEFASFAGYQKYKVVSA
jgi:hypothetical protein